MDDVTLLQGDCLTILPTLADGSIDAIVTDPPAGIRFMGSGWDTFPTRTRPDGFAFGDGRPRPGISAGQEHRASERGAFVAFLTAAMAECLRVARPGARALVWAIPRTSHWTGTAIEDAGWIIEDRISHLFAQGFPKHKSKLKPAVEDWWLARKASKNVPPLNIDDCRIVCESRPLIAGMPKDGKYPGVFREGSHNAGQTSEGRWPANVVLTCCGEEPHAEGCPVAELDRQSGIKTTAPPGRPSRGKPTDRVWCEDGGWEHNREFLHYADCGGASRFYYCAKASPEDRGEGNTHPTVKNTELMRWLIKLITHPRDLVLDPFAGSGSALVACYQTDRRCIGIESESAYIPIIKQRIKSVEMPLFKGFGVDILGE